MTRPDLVGAAEALRAPNPLAIRPDPDLLGDEPWHPDACCGDCPAGAESVPPCPHADACNRYEAWAHESFLASEDRLSVSYVHPAGRHVFAQLSPDAPACFVGGPRGHDAHRHEQHLRAMRFGHDEVDDSRTPTGRLIRATLRGDPGAPSPKALPLLREAARADLVERWHLGEWPDRELRDVLGMTEDEYARWVVAPSSFDEVSRG